MSSINPRDRANFAELINQQLDALPIQSQEDARVAATALRSLIDPTHHCEIPPALQGRISEIHELMSDPLSVGDEAAYPEGHLQQYQQIARERIPAKINELLHMTPEGIAGEAMRIQDQKSSAERDQEYLRNRQPPTGEASTVSEAAWLRMQQEEFQREAPPARRERPRLEPLQFVSDALRDNQDFVLQALRQNAQPLHYTPPELARDVAEQIPGDAVHEAVQRYRTAMARRGEVPMRNDRFANAEEAIQYLQDHMANIETSFRALPERWHRDRAVVLAAVRMHGTLNGCDSLIPFSSDREISLAAVRQNAIAYMNIDRTLQRDRNFAIEAVRANVNVFDSLSDELQHDPDVRREAHR